MTVMCMLRNKEDQAPNFVLRDELKEQKNATAEQGRRQGAAFRAGMLEISLIKLKLRYKTKLAMANYLGFVYSGMYYVIYPSPYRGQHFNHLADHTAETGGADYLNLNPWEGKVVGIRTDDTPGFRHNEVGEGVEFIEGDELEDLIGEFVSANR